MHERFIRLFLENFHEVAKIGATSGGGVNRQAASAEDQRSRDWFAAFAAERDWPVTVDQIGNMFALVKLVQEPDTEAILVGSHLDSQPNGGRFDGAYGVMAGLHAAAALEDAVNNNEITAKHDLIVVNWFNEEGGRFAPSLMGSAVYTKRMDLDEMLKVEDPAGISVEEALESIGYRTKHEGPQNVAGYAEIHIEQGLILEREGVQLGVVESSWYTQKLDIKILGEQAHTGATVMDARRDALAGAAQVILDVEGVTRDFPSETLVSSVGQMRVEPNSPVVVNSEVYMVADLRANSPQIVRNARDKLLKRFEQIAKERNLEIMAKDVDIRPNIYFPIEGVELAEEAAAELQMPVRRMQTMAGHDSISMNAITPSVMLFIPSQDGISHSEREFTSDTDMVAGLRWLYAVLIRMVEGALDKVNFPGTPKECELALNKDVK